MERYFRRLYEAAVRLRKAEEQLESMHQRAIFSGRGEGMCTGYLDPMRNVDDYLDCERTLHKSLRDDVTMVNDFLGMFDAIGDELGYRASLILLKRYVGAKEWERIAVEMGLEESAADGVRLIACKSICRLGRIGLYGLRERSANGKDGRSCEDK